MLLQMIKPSSVIFIAIFFLLLSLLNDLVVCIILASIDIDLLLVIFPSERLLTLLLIIDHKFLLFINFIRQWLYFIY